jgi:hypothetical protein
MTKSSQRKSVGDKIPLWFHSPTQPLSHPIKGPIGTHNDMKVDNTVEVISQPPHVPQRRTTAVIYLPD